LVGVISLSDGLIFAGRLRLPAERFGGDRRGW